MPADQPTDQYILVADLLGFSDAVKEWSGGQRDLLIDMMRWISTARASFGIRTLDDRGSPGLYITPQISTFSDLIAVSFPVEPPLTLAPSDAAVALAAWPSEVLRHMAKLCAEISMRSLRLGLALRGGLCRGELLHSTDIILGPAFIKAYDYERCIAKVPRIAVCPDVYGDNTALFPDPLRTDGGGDVADLDFMPELAALLNNRGDRHGWRASRLQQMEDDIARYSKTNSRIANKWRWFRTRFEQGTLGLLP